MVVIKYAVKGVLCVQICFDRSDEHLRRLQQTTVDSGLRRSTKVWVSRQHRFVDAADGDDEKEKEGRKKLRARISVEINERHVTKPED